MRVFFFSPIPYHFLRQRPQQLADRLAARSVTVTYIEPSGWREYLSGERKGFIRALCSSIAYHVSAVVRMLVGRKTARPVAVGAVPQPASSPEILTLPLTVPVQKCNSALIDRLVQVVMRRFLERNVLAAAAAAQSSVAIVEHPLWGAVIAPGDFSRVCYDCLDDLSIYVGRNSPERIAMYERQLVNISSAICVTAHSLREHLNRTYPGSAPHLLPNGVEFEAFERVRVRGNEMGGKRAPVAGYVGALSGWFDTGLVLETARALPHVDFQLVGPVSHRHAARALAGESNIHLLGRRPYEEIPGLIGGFDVCLIPFRSGEIAESTNPVKLYEYFALGRPVVSTALSELDQLEAAGLVYTGNDPASFREALLRALEEHDPGKVEARKNVARTNSWDARVDALLHIVRGEG